MWQVAQDVGVAPLELLEVLKTELGEYVPAVFSKLEMPVVRRVYEHFNVAYEGPVPAWRKTEPPQPSPANGLTPPKKQARRDNHPLMNQRVRPRDAVRDRLAELGWEPWRETNKHPQPAQWASRSVEQQWEDANTDDASDAFAF